MTATLILIETRRLLARGRVWAIVAVAIAFGVVNLADGGRADDLRFAGSFVAAGGLAFQGLAPLMAGVISAGALAEDRSRGFPALVMSRGISRTRYLLAKAAAMAFSAAAATAVAGLAILAIALVMLPSGRAVVGHGSGPIPSLFASAPLANDLVAIAFLAAGAGAVAVSGVLVGVLVPNEYIAAVVPFALTVAGLFLLSGAVTLVSPFTYFDLGTEYRDRLPDWALPAGALVYWAAFSAIAVVGALRVSAIRELR